METKSWKKNLQRSKLKKKRITQLKNEKNGVKEKKKKSDIFIDKNKYLSLKYHVWFNIKGI